MQNFLISFIIYLNLSKYNEPVTQINEVKCFDYLSVFFQHLHRK